jgi:hypothetical protein
VLRQINDAFAAAQRQLSDLRAAVEQTSVLARQKLHGDVLTRHKERALMDLGEQVWAAVKKGRLELPSGFSAALRGVEEAERKQAAQASDITALLAEGEETAGRKNPRGASKSTVAGRGKKR